MPSFHPRLVGLTGPMAEIERVAASFKVFHERRGTEDGSYTVDHSAFVYLMDREGRYLGFFPPNTSAERMLTIIRPQLGTN